MAALRNLSKLTSHSIPKSISISSSRGFVTKLFIGGLSFYTTQKGLLEAFSEHGQVIEAKVVSDRVTERSKGFGFVIYASEDEAEKATREMNGMLLDGRAIFVDYAKPFNDFGSAGLIARGPPPESVKLSDSVIASMEEEIS